MWESLFKFSRTGHKFCVEEVYKKQRGKQSKKYGFVDDIEELVIDLLVQDIHRNGIFLSKNKLFKELHMVNVNYNYGRYNIPKLSKLIKINETDIREFYDLSKSALIRAVERGLNSLQDKSLVTWHNATTICIVDTSVTYNDDGVVKANKVHKGLNEYGEEILDYNISYRAKHIHREATEEEIEKIMQIEREKLDEMHTSKKSELVATGKWEQFSKKVREEIFDRHNILYYYESYKIICNKKHLYELWDELKELSLTELQREITHLNLNEEVKSKLLKNAETRHKKANEVDPFVMNDVQARRSKEQYIEDSINMINTLIDMFKDDIREEIKRIK